MKNGQIFYAKTHADFLNTAFGTHYKAWMKCVWKYNSNMVVWMVRFNKNDGGWRNTFISNNQIMEENIGKVKIWDGKPVEWLDKTRIVVEIIDQGVNRRYIFKGVYEYNAEKSNPSTVRYYDKIADEI